MAVWRQKLMLVKASSDPVRVAAAMMTLASLDEAPAALLIGADAVAYVQRAADAVAENDRKWHDLSVSTKAD